MEQGDTPSSLAHDSLDGVPGYRPHKAMHEHGAATFRAALAGSYNLAAVDVLNRVGVSVTLERLRLAGLGPLAGTTGDYGLDLALGTPRVRLLDLAAAYGFLVDAGVVVPPRALADARPSPGTRVYSAEASWLTMDVLSDPQARRATFGADLPLDLPFRVAAKTGTSSGFADTVTIGATREAIAAAWVGSFDGSGTTGKLAMWSAAPLVRAALLAVADLRGAPLTLPAAPSGPAAPSHQ
jgi:penicillin-binding protein 1C